MYLNIKKNVFSQSNFVCLSISEIEWWASHCTHLSNSIQFILDAGSDLQGIRTNAKKDGDDYILNGSKVFITNGILADVVVVVAITDANAKAKAHGISLFVVEDGMKGFKKGRNL